MNNLTEILGIIFTVLGTVKSFADKKLIKRFRVEKATDRATAIVLTGLKFFEKKLLQKYMKAFVIKVDENEKKYYLDENQFKAYKRKKRKRAIILIISTLTVLAFMLSLDIFAATP